MILKEIRTDTENKNSIKEKDIKDQEVLQMKDIRNLIENRKEDSLTSMNKKIDMNKNVKDTIT